MYFFHCGNTRDDKKLIKCKLHKIKQYYRGTNGKGTVLTIKRILKKQTSKQKTNKKKTKPHTELSLSTPSMSQFSAARQGKPSIKRLLIGHINAITIAAQ